MEVEKVNEEPEEEPDLLNNENKIEWTGYITVNKKQRVGVDAYFLKGDSSSFPEEHNLNVKLRL